MQNLKGVISLFLAPQDIAWTEELKEQTSWRLEDAASVQLLTLMENDIFLTLMTPYAKAFIFC